MAYEYNGKTIETNESGYLMQPDDWDKGLAELIAKDEGLELTSDHWDVINYFRDEFFNNRENIPNNRAIMKDMGKTWGRKVGQKDLYDLFPGNPSKQGGKIAGLPESRRKGGY